MIPNWLDTRWCFQNLPRNRSQLQKISSCTTNFCTTCFCLANIPNFNGSSIKLIFLAHELKGGSFLVLSQLDSSGLGFSVHLQVIRGSVPWDFSSVLHVCCPSLIPNGLAKACPSCGNSPSKWKPGNALSLVYIGISYSLMSAWDLGPN
jgi:hypothetical protein